MINILLAMTMATQAQPMPPPVVRIPAPPPPPALLIGSGRPEPAPNRELRPVSQPRIWVSPYHYPEAAREEGRTGETEVELTVNRWGSVSDCHVLSSSGHRDLDEAACQALAVNGRFYPAMDGDMQPVASSWRHTVKWTEARKTSDNPRRVARGKPPVSLPSAPAYFIPTSRNRLSEDYPEDALAAKAEGTTEMQLTIDESGTVTRCEIVESSGHTSLDEASCERARAIKARKPALDFDGNPTMGRVERRVRWTLPKDHSEVAMRAVPTMRPRPMPFKGPGKAGFTMTVDKDGSVSDCKEFAAGAFADKPIFNRFCEKTGSRPVEPFEDEDGDPVAKTVSVVVDVSLDDPARPGAEPGESDD